MSWMRSETYLTQFLRDFLPTLTDRSDMILDVYRGRKTTKQQQRQQGHLKLGQPQHEQLLQKKDTIMIKIYICFLVLGTISPDLGTTYDERQGAILSFSCICHLCNCLVNSDFFLTATIYDPAHLLKLETGGWTICNCVTIKVTVTLTS